MKIQSVIGLVTNSVILRVDLNPHLVVLKLLTVMRKLLVLLIKMVSSSIKNIQIK